MTAKYELTKLYRNHAEITITTNSFIQFLADERTTLDYIVQYQFQAVNIRAKPRKPNYKNYVLV